MIQGPVIGNLWHPGDGCFPLSVWVDMSQTEPVVLYDYTAVPLSNNF